jgi:ABC-2 type transport system ATP-binding protein
MNAFELEGVTKRYDGVVALNDVTVGVPRQSIVGLIGRNGSGKSTLLRHVTGLVLPDQGKCVTLGRTAAQLGETELSRIGVVEQDATYIEWMRVEQLVRYVSTFYARWDRALESALMSALDVNPQARVGGMSPGNVQRLALVLATCHHPELLLLDEPLSDLDPIARQAVLAMLLDRFSSDDMTIVISSHMLRDIEPVVNRIVCMHRGRVVADDELDMLRERYAEWIVTSATGRLPVQFREPYILSAQSDGVRARLLVRAGERQAAQFAAQYDAQVTARALNLEQLFPLLAADPDIASPMASTDFAARELA